MHEDNTQTSQPVELPIAKLGKCTKCKYYRPCELGNIEYDAYCDNPENKGKHISAILLCIEKTSSLEPITLSTAQRVFRKECEKVLDFINDYGSPIVGSIYGRECYTEGAGANG